MLKFYPKPGLLTPWPNSHFGGQARRYVGRVFTPPSGAEFVKYPAADEPAQIQDDDADAPHLLRKVKKGELWPADEHTARAAGVSFVKLAKGQDGEWFPAPPSKKD